MSVTKREAAHGVDRVTRFQGENAHMSSPILPIEDPSGPRFAGCAAPVVGDVDDLLTQLNANGRALSIAVVRVGPPREVLEQVATAAAIERRMRAAGQRVRFLPAGPGGRTQVEIHDRDGSVRSLTLTEAFELATGRPLD
jgi:hypothetical protein